MSAVGSLRRRCLRPLAAPALLAAVIAVGVSFAAAGDAFAAAGDLDSSFSGDGKVATNVSTGYDWANAVAVQADGKIVVAGAARNGGAFAVVRYNSDGTLDTTFSGDGMVITNLTRKDDFVNGLAIQADGKIIAAGEAGSGGSNPKFALVRYNTDGTLDGTFGSGGKVQSDFAPKEDFANAVAVQADGKIVAAGPEGVGGSNGKFGVVRFNTDGTLDNTFSGDGKATADFTPHRDWVNGLGIQADGAIVVDGITGGRNERFAVARFLSDGQPDSSFGGDGKVTTDFTTKTDQATSLAIQADGKIVASGVASQNGSNPRFALARYNTDGTLDSTFSSDGKLTTDFTPKSDWGYGVAVASDGTIVAAGFAGWGGTNGKFAVARYTSDGHLDTTFGGDGRVTTDFTGKLDWAFAVALQADGNIVAAGQSGWGTRDARIAVARYLAS